MNKKEFLKALEKELINLDIQDMTNILEYYDELIEDQIESGIKEKEVIGKLSIYEIIKEVKADKRINDAVAKPTLSNGIKALIAFLGILSFPMLMTVGAVIFAILISIFAIIFALIATIGALYIATIICSIVFIISMLLGQLPVATSLFCLGVSLIFVGIFTMLIKWSFIVSKDMTIWIINLIKEKYNKCKGGIK